MEEYTQKIKVVLEKDKSSFDQISGLLDSFSKKGIVDPEKSDKFTADLKKWQDTMSEINYLQQQLNALQNVHIDGIEEVTKQIQEQIRLRKQELGIGEDLSGEGGEKKQTITARQFFLKELKQIGDKFQRGLKETFDGAIKELNNMLSASRLTNTQTRETMFRYGFSQSQAYGYQKALQLTGVGSLENLMAFGSELERKQFQEAFTKYSQKYTELYDKGFFDQLQQFNYEMADFKQEVQMELIGFFMENKNEIMTAMRGLIKLSEFVVQALGWIVSHWGGGGMSDSQRAALVSEAVNNYVSNNQSKTNNITINNKFDGVNTNDASWITNASQLMYQATRKALV